MKRIKYIRKYDVTVVEEYEADVPDHLLEMEYVGVNGDLDQYVTDNHSPDREDRLHMVEDSLAAHFTVRFSHDD